MEHPLYKQIQNDIRRRIRSGELQAGALVPSEKELAQQYGVSQITSKNALNGLVEEGLIVRFRGKGTFVREDGSPEVREHPPVTKRTIAIILPTMKTKIDQQLLDGLERYCAGRGYDLLFRITRESPEEESRTIEQFRERGVDGFIIFPVEQESYNTAILRLSLDQVPLVLVDRFLKEIKTYSVSSDNYGGVREAVSGLLAAGHTRIAYLSPEITNSVTDERAKGFEAAFMEQGLPIDKTLWCMLDLGTIGEGRGQREIERFLRARRDVTAVFAVNAELARYASNAIRENGLGTGSSPQLAAFDDPDLEGVPYVHQQLDDVCRIAVDLLSEQLSGTFEPRREVVPVRWIWPQ
ncbi:MULTISPECIES: GntR family transcriptional regulator [Paenibacillus]|uniref:Transcriptional regulator, GntR family with LacI sensor n=1 Tax=Paenibacillus lactis 154 TaxID=743719 RepID=G4HJK6_9BACL|nr:GntR family transcriptional regulator [Paenibacillus lactis]EHB62460.1 transcriptional regulator, GntR family with LacI sensor [Paenibacillus lactis 154]MCM3492282.1 GntR family transcriptional regulator [Paenibacillus lactis]